jgi:hypothetical protein
MNFLFKPHLALLLISTTIPSNAQNSRVGGNLFQVSFTDCHSLAGYSYTYNFVHDSLFVTSDCDPNGCVEKVIYRQKIDDAIVDEFVNYVSQIRIDTLKSRYVTRGFDGLSRVVILKRRGEDAKCILLERFDHPVIDELVEEVKKLIADPKIRALR